MMLPPTYRICAHNHPTDDGVTVRSSALYVEMGDTPDAGQGEKFGAGGLPWHGADDPLRLGHG